MGSFAEKSFIPLPRAGIRVKGPGAGGFLQGLISNDIHLLETAPLIYACLLTPQGKFLHDFFVTRESSANTESYLLDCEPGPRQEDLLQRLLTYRLRHPIKIEKIEDFQVFALSSEPRAGNFEPATIAPDPRHPELELRVMTHESKATRARLIEQGFSEKPFEVWDAHRIALTIPDGSRDAEVGVSTLDELGIPALNGVSFTKGCYVGQELTARLHHRGGGKRHLKTINLKEKIPDGAEIRSRCGDMALALVKKSD